MMDLWATVHDNPWTVVWVVGMLILVVEWITAP